tara:strand:- start:1186 stop:1365 length:180 start_codon:yes stop_codon:yes gene_type:complete
MEKEKVNALKSKLQKIGKDSLVLISKCKHEGIGNNEMYDLAIKINQLAHEIHNSLEKEF